MAERSIQSQNQPKVAEQETRGAQTTALEVIHGQRLPFLLNAAAQTPFVQRFLSSGTMVMC
jgi:hypothetical protein